MVAEQSSAQKMDQQHGPGDRGFESRLRLSKKESLYRLNSCKVEKIQTIQAQNRRRYKESTQVEYIEKEEENPKGRSQAALIINCPFQIV